MCCKLTLMCIEVSCYHSAKTICGSKNLMYTTIAPRKFKEKVYKKKRVCKESMKLKVETSTQQLKKVAKSG